MERFTGLLGLAFILGAAWLFSRDRKRIRLSLLLWGLGLQLTFALLVLKTGAGGLFHYASVAVNALFEYVEAGSGFVFGEALARKPGRMVCCLPSRCCRSSSLSQASSQSSITSA